MPTEFPAETLPHLIRHALEEPRAEALIERGTDGWKATSTAQILERAENVACAIRAAGLSQGDRVSLIAHNSVAWVICDFATFFAGCVVVPIFPTQALDHTEFILKHADVKLLFVDNDKSVERLKSAGIALPQTIVFERTGAGSLAEFETHGAEIRASNPTLPQAYEQSSKPEDLAVLIYTSGTTGVPKGVMLSHDNLTFDARAALTCGLNEFRRGEDVLSVLPFSHIYEHTMIYIYLLAGMRYNICHDANELLADLLDTRPIVMTAVPRIFDRVLSGVKGKAMQAGGAQAKLVPWALEAGREYMIAKTFGRGPSLGLSIQYAIASKLVLGKVRERLGLDRVAFLLSGSAALHTDVAMTFLGMGVPIMQGYGLTETSPVHTTSQVSANRYGAVGKTIPEVSVKIAGDGEILASGRNVMMGYYREPEATAAAIVDGWFHTGDIGDVDADGYLRITDRKKEIFKTATGKYVSPARVESALKRSVFVAQAMVIGDGRPFPEALVSPNWDTLRVELSLPQAAPEDLSARDDVKTFIAAEARKQTSDLASYEQIRNVIVLPREFTVESGELSPSMKIKRRVVEERYKTLIEHSYADDAHAHV
jgi:long-chain acyl-CoA synthetase